MQVSERGEGNLALTLPRTAMVMVMIPVASTRTCLLVSRAAENANLCGHIMS